MMYDGYKVKWQSKDGKIIMTASGFSDWYYLYYNGIQIGTSYTEVNWKDPEAWAKRQLKKRLAVIERNRERIYSELEEWENEREELLK